MSSLFRSSSVNKPQKLFVTEMQSNCLGRQAAENSSNICQMTHHIKGKKTTWQGKNWGFDHTDKQAGYASFLRFLFVSQQERQEVPEQEAKPLDLISPGPTPHGKSG